jgi:hypothetical protein
MIVSFTNDKRMIYAIYFQYTPMIALGFQVLRMMHDYGNTNSSNTLTSQLAIIYNAPASSLVIQSSGYVQMAYNFKIYNRI